MNSNDKLNIIANSIRKKKLEKGYTSEELANRTGLNISIIKKAEKGSKMVNFEDYIIIFLILGLIDYNKLINL